MINFLPTDSTPQILCDSCIYLIHAPNNERVGTLSKLRRFSLSTASIACDTLHTDEDRNLYQEII